MLNLLRHWLVRLLGNRQVEVLAIQKKDNKSVVDAIELSHQVHVPAHDEHLLERARTQWQFGDWQSLASLNKDTLQHHPDRATLALLAASGLQQIGDAEQARAYTHLAQEWGCSKKLIAQLLIAGVHNSIGRAAVLAGDQSRAVRHFEAALAAGTPGSDTLLLVQARTSQQYQQLGLSMVSLDTQSGTASFTSSCISHQN